MKPGTSWLSILFMFIVGLFLIIMHNGKILAPFVMIFGILLILPAVYSLIAAQIKKKDDLKRPVPLSILISSIAACALGIWMLVQPSFFIEFLAYAFGALLIAYGIFRIVILGMASRNFIIPGWFFAIPVILVIAGFVIICSGVRTIESAVVLIMGIALVLAAINAILENTDKKPKGNAANDDSRSIPQSFTDITRQ